VSDRQNALGIQWAKVKPSTDSAPQGDWRLECRKGVARSAEELLIEPDANLVCDCCGRSDCRSCRLW